MNFIYNHKLTEKIIKQMPYVQFMNIQIGYDKEQPENLIFHQIFQDIFTGNPLVPAMHGGAIGGLMNVAILSYFYHITGENKFPEIIDFSVDYLRFAETKDMYAQCILTRKGRRISQANIKVWQEPNREIAVVRVHCLTP